MAQYAFPTLTPWVSALHLSEQECGEDGNRDCRIGPLLFGLGFTHVAGHAHL